MNPAVVVAGRARTYALLAGLFESGLTPGTRPLVAALPELDALVHTDEPDEWAAAHYEALGRQVFAHEGVFLGDGQLGGEVAASVHAFSVRVGHTTRSEPDHLASELGVLAHLSAAERDARQDGLEQVAARMRDLQRTFLSEHLLRWIPAVAIALQRSRVPFYANVADLAAELVADHARDLGAEVAESPRGGDHADPLEDEKTGLKKMSRFLLRPASGWFLSQRVIGLLAQQADVPEGFGSRPQKLESVLFAAADHGRSGRLLRALIAEANVWDGLYAEFAARGLPTAPWRTALKQTAQALERMLSALETAGNPGIG